jgi:hypothetical protein
MVSFAQRSEILLIAKSLAGSKDLPQDVKNFMVKYELVEISQRGCLVISKNAKKKILGLFRLSVFYKRQKYNSDFLCKQPLLEN